MKSLKVIDLFFMYLVHWVRKLYSSDFIETKTERKYIGTDENWEKAENAIINAAADKGLNTVVEYGEAAGQS
jgi:threonyl-tRNA synthetase